MFTRSLGWPKQSCGLSADALDVGLAFSDVLAQDIEWLPLHRSGYP